MLSAEVCMLLVQVFLALTLSLRTHEVWKGKAGISCDKIPQNLGFHLIVEYGFLCVNNITWELIEGMYLNIVVIITYFVASLMLSL